MSNTTDVDKWQMHHADKDNTRAFDTRGDAEGACEEMASLGMEVDVYPPGESPHDDSTADGGEVTMGVDECVHCGDPIDDGFCLDCDDGRGSEWTPGDDGTPAAKASEPDGTPTLQEDPIGYLEQMNPDFVNTVKGTPGISKRGFRYIQAELDITTESEVVGWVEEPYGVVVWARAELPDGRAAEAHGEGYPSESGCDDSEFVRYADSRAKNRALSDLTSAGALAVDELRGGIDE